MYGCGFGGKCKDLRLNFDRLEMVRTINKLGMEVCCTLGMITENQAHRLAEAGFICLQSQLRYIRGILQRSHFNRFEDRLQNHRTPVKQMFVCRES
jgi:biotin synthase-like enzyme